MKTSYIIKDPDKGIFAAAIADVVKMPVDSTRREYYVITRINVMERYRGQGYGTKILNQILEDADAEGVTLYLEPSPSGGLSLEELKAWYERHGFTEGVWHMRRKARVAT
jgi:GNAT superfamily N-acetyltransferase